MPSSEAQAATLTAEHHVRPDPLARIRLPRPVNVAVDAPSNFRIQSVARINGVWGGEGVGGGSGKGDITRTFDLPPGAVGTAHIAGLNQGDRAQQHQDTAGNPPLVHRAFPGGPRRGS